MTIKRTKNCFFCVAFFLLAALLVPLQANAQRSKYRKVKNGVGNCIFSASPLPHKRESTYRNLKTRFNVAKVKRIYARCYAPKKLRDYAKLGRIVNTIRESKKYKAVFWVLGSQKHTVHSIYPLNATTRNWDQFSFKIGRIRKSEYAQYRESLVDAVKSAMKRTRKTSVKFCIYAPLDYADRYTGRFVRTSNGFKRILKKIKTNIVYSCMQLHYTP